MSVTVIIKSATQSVEDFGVECELSWNIGYLKEVLEESYPDNPKKEHQKLIYGGKLLPDHLPLKSILNYSQERHIFHLVCPTPSKVNTNESKQAAPQSFPVPPINPGFAPLDPPSFSAMPEISAPSVNVTTDPFQQYLAMQQMYAQFMTQYLSQYNGAVPPVVPQIPPMSMPQAQTPEGPASPQNVTPNRQRRRAPEDERDYLDYFYIFSRALLLFAALYYYSSLNRILLVITMFICMSMYVRINRQIQHRQREIQRQANEAARRQSAPSEQAPSDTEPTEVEESVTTRNEEDVSTPPAAENNSSSDTLSQQSEQRNFMSAVTTTTSLVSAFFSSLIPSDPVPVNVN